MFTIIILSLLLVLGVIGVLATPLILDILIGVLIIGGIIKLIKKIVTKKKKGKSK